MLPVPAIRFAAVRARHGVLAALLSLAAVLAGCASLPDNTQRSSSAALPAGTATPLAALVDRSAPSGDAGSRSGFRLLGSVESAFGSRLALIDTAARTLDLQYYAIHYDTSAQLLMDRLRAAARRGVRVRVLLDDFNAAGANAAVLRLDLEPGIEVRTFNPLTGPRGSQLGRLAGSVFDMRRIHQRMHNKLLVADNAIAITGGRNLGDEYFGQGNKKNFLDLDVLVAGAMVPAFSRSFDAYWAHPLAYPVRTLLSPRELERLNQPPDAPDRDGQAPGRLIGSSAAGGSSLAGHGAAGATTEQAMALTTPGANALASPAAPAGAAGVDAPGVPGASNVMDDILGGHLRLHWAPAVLMVDKPEKISAEDPLHEQETVVDGLLQLMGGTRRDLLVVSPYFVPGPRMLTVFQQLRHRGVRVRVLTNSLAATDAPLAHVGYARWRVPLLQAGVELYEMRAQGEPHRRLAGSAPQSRASLHSKALVQDGMLLVVGSMNLDLRSQFQNTELGVVIRSRALARDLAANIEQTMADSYRVEWVDGALRWQPPSQDQAEGRAAPAPLASEPDAGLGVRLLLQVIGPFAPDELL